MSTERDIEFLRSEIVQLDQLIAECTDDEAPVRMGFESRLREVKEELVEAEHRLARIGIASLTFRGAPVVGTRGIEAEFAGEVLESFQKLVAKATAAHQGVALGTRGPIPGGDRSKLLVTSTTVGSFGFVLEEADPAGVVESPLRAGLEEATRLLEASKDDETFAEAVEQTDPEVLSALSRFLEVMVDGQATLHCFTGQSKSLLDEVTQVADAYRRTSTVQHPRDSSVQGILEGLLPNSRRFEFRERDTGQVISGRISKDVGDMETWKSWVDRESTAHMRITLFQGVGKEHRRYELRGLSEPHPE